MVEDEEHFRVGCPVKRPFAQIDGLKKLNQDLGCCMTRKNVSAQCSMRTQTVEWAYRCSIGSCNRLGYRLGEGQMSL